MKFLKKIKKRSYRIIAKIAIFVIVLNGTFISALVPEAKAAPLLQINEVMPNGANNPSESDEFIEIYNPSGDIVSIDGYMLSDAGGAIYIFPAGTNILPGGFVSKTRTETSIPLNNGGDTVYLKDFQGGLNDSVIIPDSGSKEGQSYARRPDGSSNWVWDTTPTPGATNNNQVPTTPVLSNPADASFTKVSHSFPLSWTASTDADSDPITYYVIVNTQSDFSGPNAISGSTAGTSYMIMPAQALADGTYYWKVRAYDGSDYSAWSSVWSFTVDTTVPTIANLQADPNPFSPNGDMVKDVSTLSYDVSEDSVVDISIKNQSNNPVRDLALNKSVSQGQNSENWDGTDNGGITVPEGTYTAYITAEDLAGNVSSLYSADINVDLTAPFATSESKVNTSNPTNNNNPVVTGKYSLVTSVSYSSLTVKTASDVVKISVVFDNGSSKYEKEATMDPLTGTYTTANNNSYLVTSASPYLIQTLPDGTYKVTTLAFDLAGNSTPESVENALAVDTVAPQSPMNLQVEAKSPDSITLSWTASNSTDVAGYRVYWGTESGKYTNVRDVGNSTSAVVNGLSSNTVYYFMVKAYDKAGNESLGSGEVSEKTTQALSLGISGSVSASSGFWGEEGENENIDNKGMVESAQAAGENKEQKTEENKEEQQTAGTKRNNLFLLAIIILILGVAGYYYYSMNPDKFKNIKFPKLPGLKK